MRRWTNLPIPLHSGLWTTADYSYPSDYSKPNMVGRWKLS